MANVVFLCEKQLEKIPVVETVKNQFGAEIMYFDSRSVSVFLRNHPADYVAVYLDAMSVNSQKELLFLIEADIKAELIFIGRREACKYYYEKAEKYKKFCIFFPFALPDFITSFAEIIKGQGTGFSMEEDVPVILPSDVKRHVLVVDDDAIFLRTMMNWLKQDFSVSVVKSGRDALDFLTKELPDLILLDYEMPVMDGTKTLEKIRSNLKYANIPVIFLTGVTDSSMVKDAVKLKPQGYILKNISKNVLIEKIKEFIG
jgi:CheY-like chemotaxis protein